MLNVETRKGKDWRGKITLAEKIVRDGWSNIVDEPGEFAMISKRDLLIDETYQRSLQPSRAKDLAAHWSWIACGVISVSIRRLKNSKASTYMVIDGQHRVAAAMMREDIDLLPCLVYVCTEVVDEAVGFLALNSHRAMPTTIAKFKALVIAKDPHALIASELAASIGRTIGPNTNATSVACAAAMLKCIADDEAAMRRVWPVVAAICEGRGIQQDFLFGMWTVERRLDGASLAEKRWRQRLLTIGLDGLDASIRASVAYHGVRGLNSFADGIVKAINKGLRNPIPYMTKE